jgi:uncharacterized protein (UPF0332 family)
MPHDISPLELAKYRLETAKEDLFAAQKNIESELYRASVNRSYYAIFHAARALLAFDGKDYKKHSGVISHFQREYVKTKKFDVTYSDIIFEAFNARNETDYKDFYILSKEAVVRQIENAEAFINAVEQYIAQWDT